MLPEPEIEFEKRIIEKEFQETIKQITDNYTPEEREGWDLQLVEAKKVINWETSEVLQAMCNENWEDINVFAQTIIDKANAYSLAYATALWLKQAKLKALYS